MATTEKQAKTSGYRPEIDGLRAIAILAVVLYHLRVPGFMGAFIGVDVFFAISGFVIFSRLNQEKTATGRIDWIAFFARRAIRLLPELTVMIALITVLGKAVLLPLGGQQDLAKTGLAGATWISNIYFWLHGGDYFSPHVERQPLLHLWSLAIEEQFYLMTPGVFLAAVWLCNASDMAWRTSLSAVLAALGLLSAMVALWSATNAPLAGYYLPPARICEFVAGALTAVWFGHAGSVRAATAAAVLGLTVAGASALTFSNALPFPGLWALIPVTGVCLLIWGTAVGNANPVTVLLSLRPLTYLGKISYGWYLWHLPLLVLWREYTFLDDSRSSEIVVACLALLPAALGFQLTKVLREIRSRRGHENAITIRWSVGAMLGIAMLSASLGADAKFSEATTPEVTVARSAMENYYRPEAGCMQASDSDVAALPDCLFGDPAGDVTLLIWGDSHANHWIPALDPVFKRLRVRGVERARSGCPPLQGDPKLMRAVPNEKCVAFNELVLKDIDARSRHGRMGVLLSARWGFYASDSPLSVATRALSSFFPMTESSVTKSMLESAVAKLTSLRVPIGMILQFPEQRLIAPTCLLKLRLEQCEVAFDDEKRYMGVSARFTQLASASAAAVFDPSALTCQTDRCAIRKDGVLLYQDDNHLSQEGAKLFASQLVSFVETMRSVCLLRTRPSGQTDE